MNLWSGKETKDILAINSKLNESYIATADNKTSIEQVHTSN